MKNCTLPSPAGEVNIQSTEISINKLNAFRNKTEVGEICKQGCPNYSKSWSCPPNVESFTEYCKTFTKARVYLFVASTELFLDKKNPLIECYDRLKKFSGKYLLDEEIKQAGRAIISHTCDVCDECTILKGERCAEPEKIRYHMTSFGFRVDAICQELFDHHISWGNDSAPAEYVSQVGVVLY